MAEKDRLEPSGGGSEVRLERCAMCKAPHDLICEFFDRFDPWAVTGWDAEECDTDDCDPWA